MPIYFDNAATSHPKPPSVIKAVERALTETNANPGRSGHRAAIEAARSVLSCREKLARLLDTRISILPFIPHLRRILRRLPPARPCF